MLDLMRRKQRGLKFVLWIVIIGLGAGMLLLFVDVGGPGTGIGFSANQAVASVDGQDISVQQFRSAYYNLYDSYRRYYNLDTSNTEMLKFLRIDGAALDKLIRDRIVKRESERLGLDVSQAELLDALRKIPGLNENNRFIGRARLEQLLRANNSSLAEFEYSLTSELLTQKLRGLITDGVQVSDGDIRKEFLESSQQAAIQYVAFTPEASVGDVVVVDSELRSFYEKNRDNYRVGEKRRISYLSFNPADWRSKVQITDQELRDAYNAEGDHQEVWARHILFRIEDPSRESEVRSRAEAVLAEARQGGDFAELARRHSGDDGSKASGGDLGFFTRSQMVPEFSNAAFSLAPGAISDLVKSDFGYHILKVEQKRTVTLEEKRPQLEFELRGSRADDMARSKADEAAGLLMGDPDLNKVAERLGMTVRESPVFSRDGEIPGLGQSPGLQSAVFSMKNVGEVGAPQKTALGYVVPKLLEIKEAYVPPLEEVRASVIEDYRKEKAKDAAGARARQFAAAVRQGEDLAAAARRLKLQPVTPSPFTRRSDIDDTLFRAPEVMEKAFTLPVDQPSDALELKRLWVVFRVTSRDSMDEARFAAEKPVIRERLETSRKAALFDAYLQGLDKKLRDENKILINQSLIDRVVGL